jgi:hypothetical protein
MFAIVRVAPLAVAGPVVSAAVAVGLAVAVAVPDCFSSVVVLDPPHAVATAATRHIAAQSKPSFFIVSPLNNCAFARDTIIDPKWFNYDQFRILCRDRRLLR